MIALIDYGMGNLRSVQKALELTGGRPVLVRTAAELARTEKIVLPGVAAFGDAMTQLRSQGLAGPIVEAIQNGTPYLGFCLGLQLLFETSYEDGEHAGLGILPGNVVRFHFEDGAVRGRLAVPHMGWNSVCWQRDCPVFAGLASGAYFYFAHSYHVVPADDGDVAATTEYGYAFASAVARGNVFATQFHPEKSQTAGLKLLENFVSL